MKALTFLLTIGMAAVILVACLDPVGSGTGLNPGGSLLTPPDTVVVVNPDPDPDSIPDPNALPPSFFANQVQPIFRDHCAQCHSPGSQGYAMTKLSLESDKAYAALVNIPSVEMVKPRPEMLLVKPKMPDSSYLYLKITLDNPRVGERMPLLRPKLSADDIQTIKKWIEGGAPEN